MIHGEPVGVGPEGRDWGFDVTALCVWLTPYSIWSVGLNI